MRRPPSDPRAGDERRDVDLPDGRHVAVRRAALADVPDLVTLFERLGPEDRYRRFFSGFHPDTGFVTRVVDRPPDQGAILVAEVTAGDGRELVAEAEYAVRDDGDGEVAITVDRRWRGWLAPYLLDAISEVAASHGVPNLHAEVLVQNRAMLALVRSRGHAAVETGDPTVVDAVFGTSGRVPSWPERRARPRVLVEVPGAHWRLGPDLRATGVDVVGCSGPSRRTGGCPLLRGATCPLVEGADLVVLALPRDDPDREALLAAHDRTGTRQLVVDVTGGDPGDLPSGAVGVDRPTAARVQELVRSLLQLPGDVTGAGGQPRDPTR